MDWSHRDIASREQHKHCPCGSIWLHISIGSFQTCATVLKPVARRGATYFQTCRHASLAVELHLMLHSCSVWYLFISEGACDSRKKNNIWISNVVHSIADFVWINGSNIILSSNNWNWCSVWQQARACTKSNCKKMSFIRAQENKFPNGLNAVTV